MARLTRTQKYAELRDSLTNDKETSVSTQDLSSYESRLNAITEQLSPKTEPVVEEAKPVVEEVQPVVEEPKYVWQDFKEDENIIAQPEDTEVKTEEPVVVEEVKVEEPVVEEIPVEATQEDTYYNDFTNSVSKDINEHPSFDSYFAEITDAMPETTEIPVFEASGNLETYTSETPIITESMILDEFKEEPVIEEVSIEEPVIEEVKIEEPVVEEINIEPVIIENNASILDAAINEADVYNHLNGEKNIHEVASSMINELRHNEPETELDADKVETQEPVVETTNDEQFSNTVSLEISKIMEDINAPEEIKEEAEPVEEIEETLIAERPDEEVVEIKNINELEEKPVKENTISETIPFVVQDSEELTDDEQEEGSNTVLNVILIILIVILVAVLGLIVFYILKTKNIL